MGDVLPTATVDGHRMERGRDLFLNLTRTELTARYKSTALGILWFALSPALMTVVFTVVVQHVLRLDIDRYVLVILAGILPWSFAQASLLSATTAITRAGGLVKRVRVPRAMIPLATVTASLVHFLAAMAVLVVVLPVLGGSLTPWLLALPLAILLQTAGLAGLALLTSSLNVYYRDVEHVLALVLRVGFYLTPTFYPLSMVPESWRQAALVNPLAGMVEVYRALLVDGAAPPGDVLTAAVVWPMLSLVLGAWAFRRYEPDFDDYM
jgi:ABC-2 type transport system permease protein